MVTDSKLDEAGTQPPANGGKWWEELKNVAWYASEPQRPGH